MLTDQPYYTYQIESKGLLYEAKINGVIIHRDLEGRQIVTEEPINYFMRSGKNRIALTLYPWEEERYDGGSITVSLYLNKYGESDSGKVLIGQIAFDSNALLGDEAEAIVNQQGIDLSMPPVKLDSKNRLQRDDENGDVVVHPARIEPIVALAEGTYLYQDIELEVPFPRWGYLDAELIEFPDSFEEYRSNIDYYDKHLGDPLYEVHKQLFEQLKSGDVEGFASHFKERIHETAIALYSDEDELMEDFKKGLKANLSDPDYVVRLKETKVARPSVSDDKRLVKLGGSSMIQFYDEKNSIYSHYPIRFYKKDGKWIISR